MIDRRGGGALRSDLAGISQCARVGVGGVNALWYFVNQQFSECPHRSLLPNLRIPLRAL